MVTTALAVYCACGSGKSATDGLSRVVLLQRFRLILYFSKSNLKSELKVTTPSHDSGPKVTTHDSKSRLKTQSHDSKSKSRHPKSRPPQKTFTALVKEPR